MRADQLIAQVLRGLHEGVFSKTFPLTRRAVFKRTGKAKGSRIQIQGRRTTSL